MIWRAPAARDDLEGAGGGGREKIKFEYRNPKQGSKFKGRKNKFEKNFKIQMTKIRKKSFFETFDNIRRKKS
jgi:hypothetical protein